MVLVCGPRLPAESVRAPNNVEVLGYIPRLHEIYACCDVAVVQCGASSTTELCALRRPFIYFPIAGHFEQEAVASRLVRYGAGRRMSLKGTTPESLAEAIRREYERIVVYGPMPIDGAVKAAAHILRAMGYSLKAQARFQTECANLSLKRTAQSMGARYSLVSCDASLYLGAGAQLEVRPHWHIQTTGVQT